MAEMIKIYTLCIDAPDRHELSLLSSRAGNFNGHKQVIFPDFAGSANGKLRFIVLKTDAVEMKRFRENLRDFCGKAYELKELSLSELTPELNALIADAKSVLAKSYCCGDEYNRWERPSVPDIESKIEGLVGFADFKLAMRGVGNRIKNAKALDIRVNHNIVLVKNCDVDMSFFAEMIYDFYFAHGVITDPLFVEGSLSGAAQTDRDTALFYMIVEAWPNDGGFMRHAFSDEEGDLRRLSKRKAVYLTVMDKEQYKRVREIGAFAALFPTAIFINDMSADEKLEFLEREVAMRGFELAPKGFTKSELLKGGADAIKAAAADAVTRKMTADAVPDLRLTIADFKGGRKKRTGEKSPFDELEALIGLHSVKACIREIATYVKNRGRDNIPCLHMVFRGNPGTGKTTVARILGKIFAEVGAVSKKDVFVEADRNKLVSIYLGGTAEKTTEVVKSAFGGVLFIDEAYSLCAGDGFAHDYGRESVNALVKLMEDHRRDFVCIMAGYTREMDELLDMNPGLRERVQFYVDFPDYDAGELTEIFAAMCRERKYRLSPGALRAASAHFERIAANKDERFANGRVARKAFERVALKQALRGTTDSVLRKDIDAAFADDDLARLCASSPGARRIGFAVPEDATVRKSLA